jgi:N-acetylglucosaminyl-diphospho-decaprenol L-rhamnosyltransferase
MSLFLASRVTIVILTHDCEPWIARTLRSLTGLPGSPPVIAVDNGSQDGTVKLIRREFPAVRLITCRPNLGAAARNLGVEASGTPYVAFADDDTWYAPETLPRAVDVFEAHPRVAVVTVRTLVGEQQQEDPMSSEMAASPLTDEAALPGKKLLSFMAGVSVVRRSAYLAAGGYDPRLFMGGEEELLACDLVSAGWELRYLPELTAYHQPSGQNAPRLRHHGVRNTLWFAWRRRHLRDAMTWTLHIARTAPRNSATLKGFAGAIAGLPWVLHDRRVISAELERQLRLLDVQKMSSNARRYL